VACPVSNCNAEIDIDFMDDILRETDYGIGKEEIEEMYNDWIEE